MRWQRNRKAGGLQRINEEVPGPRLNRIEWTIFVELNVNRMTLHYRLTRTKSAHGTVRVPSLPAVCSCLCVNSRSKCRLAERELTRQRKQRRGNLKVHFKGLWSSVQKRDEYVLLITCASSHIFAMCKRWKITKSHKFNLRKCTLKHDLYWLILVEHHL